MEKARRVARIWKRGALFWKSENCAKDLDHKFHCSWISFTRFVRKLRRNFSKILYFPPKIRWSPKKKVFTEIETDFSAEIGNPNVAGGAVFLWGGCLPMGGLFSIFHKKSGSKPPKTCDFANFTGQWGARAPPWLRYWRRLRQDKVFSGNVQFVLTKVSFTDFQFKKAPKMCMIFCFIYLFICLFRIIC